MRQPTTARVLAALHRYITEQHDGQKAKAAAALGVSPSLLSHMLAGRRVDAVRKVRAALGFPAAPKRSKPPRPKYRTQAGIVTALRTFIDDEHDGNTSKASEALGVVPSYLCDVLSGRRGVGPKLQQALGYESVTAYRPRA